MSDRQLFPCPISLPEANRFVKAHHRHHGRVIGHKFSIGAIDCNGALHAVAIVGRPVNRTLDDGQTLEVNRLCSDGYKNACSFLYSRAARIAKEMGYNKIITYILESETGATLRAAGWKEEGITKGRTWNMPSRKREDKHPICNKRRYSLILNDRIPRTVIEPSTKQTELEVILS